jgi:formylglycine-generating enzyme required for sulfatase activity
MKAMAKRPEDRYGTCEEFLAALDVAVDEPETRDTVAPKPVGLHVPGVIGVPAGQAEQALLHAGLGVRFDAEEHSEGAPAGVVLRQEPPAGSSLPHGGFVRLVLSRGARPPSLRMPTQRPARPVWRRPVVLVAAVIGAAALAGGFLALCSAPRPRPIPRALRQLGTNVRGGVEYLWSRDSSVMISIPAGRFTMGSDDGDADERPARQVHLDGYLIDKYEVTNRQYEEFCAKTGHAVPEDPGFIDMPDYLATRPDHPVVNVNWEDAKAYATWAGKRLPTEAEWEKAARGTDGRMFPWGDNPMDGAEPANVFDVSAARRLADDSSTVLGYEDGYLTTAPVRACPAGASPYGCLNMIGNVWEWCGDFYSADYYARAPAKNPRGPATGTSRVVRGGSWQDLEMQHLFPRAAYRHSADPSVRAPHVGFRCCLDH